MLSVQERSEINEKSNEISVVVSTEMSSKTTGKRAWKMKQAISVAFWSFARELHMSSTKPLDSGHCTYIAVPTIQRTYFLAPITVQ